MELGTQLKETVKRLRKPTSLCKEFRNISKVPNPVRYLSKPMFMVLILLEKIPDFPNSFKFDDKKKLDQHWTKYRVYLREKDFLDQLDAFSILSVTQKKVKQIEMMRRNDPGMNYSEIYRNVRYAGIIYQYVEQVLEAYNLAI